MIFVFVWLTSLSRIISRSMHMSAFPGYSCLWGKCSVLKDPAHLGSISWEAGGPVRRGRPGTRGCSREDTPPTSMLGNSLLPHDWGWTPTAQLREAGRRLFCFLPWVPGS